MKQIQSFFIQCSGVTSSILKRTPSDINKYVSIGATIFFTGVFAGLTGAYALFIVFDSILISSLLGIIWGLMIFNLDRYIVMSLKIKKTFSKSLFQALPRVILAIIIAVVIAKPLELKMFETEIQSEVAIMRLENIVEQETIIDERYQPQIVAVKSEIQQIEDQLIPYKERRDALVFAALQEADGTGGSQKRNMGPIYKAKQIEADNAEKEFNVIRAQFDEALSLKRTGIDKLEQARMSEIDEIFKLDNAGIATKVEALARLSESSNAIYWAGIFIMLLFIAIETAPIFVKLISNNSPYDFVLDHHELIFEQNHRLKTNQLIKEIDHKLERNLVPMGI